MTSAKKQLVDIYRSKNKSGLYLYVKNGVPPSQLPEALQSAFGTGELAMTLLLHPQRKLANAEVSKVLQALADAGYYLQLPPPPEVVGYSVNAKLPL